MSRADRHSEALLGIHLAKGKGHGQARAQGSPPSDEELVLLMDGQLSEERRTEVLSHLAQRPERYRQWLSLADMDADEQASQAGLFSILSRGLNNWLIDWRYAAGGLGAMAAVLLLVNQMALPPSEQLSTADSASEDYAHAPMLEETPFAAPTQPLAESARQQQNLRMEMAEERASGMQEQMAAKRPARAPLRTHCLPTLAPTSEQSGTLCAVQMESGDHELRWIAAEANDALPLISLPQRPLQLLISANRLWLAVQSNDAIYVFDLPAAFAGESSHSQLPFTAGTARMRWDGNELLISVMQALGDSDDDLVYRYQPETGEITPPPSTN